MFNKSPHIAFSILFICIASSSFSQEECNMYYPLNEGTKYQITNFDKRDNPIAVIDYKVLTVKNTSSGKEAIIRGITKDTKEKSTVEMEFTVICKDNKLSVDFRSLFSPEMIDSMEAMEYDITGTNLDWPNELTVGETLPDANMTMKISMGGMNMNMTLDITDRKVIGKENITTLAGTFDCFVVTYDTEVNMGIRQKTSAKQWIARDVGLVKQEDFKDGKITGSSLLTEFSK